MIGEIRDLETAQIAIQASLTGHLVLATLHTNDAPSAVTRLIDMGVEPFLLASSLLGVLAQRLVRKLCPICKEERSRRRRSTGTRSAATDCGQTGYQGRRGVYELLVTRRADPRADPRPRRGSRDPRRRPQRSGMRTMREDGERLVDEGITSRGRSAARHARRARTRCRPSASKPSTPRARRRTACSTPTAPRAARAQLRAQGLVPLAVEPCGQVARRRAQPARCRFGGKPVARRELALSHAPARQPARRRPAARARA